MHIITDILSAVEEDINIKDIYDTMKIIDERHNLFVFDYRDKNKNKPIEHRVYYEH